MSQTIKMDFEGAWYGTLSYGSSSNSWHEYTEIYAGREGQASGSKYCLSKIKFSTPNQDLTSGNLELNLTIRRGHVSKYTSAILSSVELSKQEVHGADSEDEVIELNGYIAHCNGAPSEDLSTISYNLQGVTLSSNTTYFIYLKRQIGLENKQSAAETAKDNKNGFTAMYNPYKYPDKSLLTFTAEETIYPTDEEIYINPEFVQLQSGEQLSQTFQLLYNDGAVYSSSSISWTLRVEDESGAQIEIPSWVEDKGNGSYDIFADTKKEHTIQITATWGKETRYSKTATVFIPSKIWRGLKDWLSGYAIGMAMMPHPVFAREPIAYDYRGFQIPPFANYDDEKFGYVCFFKSPTMESTFIAFISDNPFVLEGNMVRIDITKQEVLYSSITTSRNNSWSEFGEVPSEPFLFAPIWTNKDIKDSNNMIIFNTYNPTPIYYKEG